jgi:regulation of enolase protein 1 (concanavalin A-like superfamily)
VACPHHAETGYQWLAFEGNMSAARRAGIFERASRNAIRVLRAGTISGSVRVHWTGTTTTWSKFLIVGASTLEPGALPSQHDTCSMPESACGACLDGFMMADCNCNVGAVDATFSHVVEAGQLVQVAAVPEQFEGAECLAGELFVAFTPGGFCDYTARGGGGNSQGCRGQGAPWDGAWLGGRGCMVERAHQSLIGEDLALEIATQGCALTKADNSAPFLYRAVGDGSDFVATVQVRDSSNVQFSAGGLLLTADEDGSRSWVALTLTQATSVAVSASTLDEDDYRSHPVSAPGPWLQLERSRGVLHLRWREADGRPWTALPQSPMQLPRALEGAVRIGLTHQTFTHNVGSLTLAHFSLVGLGAGAASNAEPLDATFANQVAWTVDECAAGPALALDEVDDHVLLPLHSLCTLDALRAPPPPSPPPPVGSVAGAFAALAARDEFFDGPSPPPPPAAAVLRLWWRTSELLGQWDSAQRYACNPV